MDKVVQSFNQIENRIIRYMFLKYIKKDNSDNEDDEVNYQEYKKKIYGLHRLRIQDQSTIIKKELFEIKKANKIYNKSLKDVTQETIEETEYGFPDKLRCNFIVNKKNNLSRCKQKIYNDDPVKYEFCSRHCNSDNIYLGKYLDFCKQI